MMHHSSFHSTRPQQPPNSTDLNLVDYAIWSVIQQCVYETKVHDIDELRQLLLYVWYSLEQLLTDYAVDQWPTCLRACVRARHGHFAHFVTINLFSLYLMQFMSHSKFTPCLVQQKCIIKARNAMFHFTR